ncbi:MAG: hypothetical protein RJA81_320 [Planctomycetota bacterium]
MKSSGIRQLLTGSIVGFGMGWFLCQTNNGARSVRAMAPSGIDQSQLVSCVVTMEYNDARKTQIPIEGLVYLDYRRGKLVGTMPEMRQIGLQKRILSNFSERDLVEDFQVEPGRTPSFLISKFSTGALSDGGQLLAVLETQTRQTRIYKLSFQQIGVEFKPEFTIVEEKVFDQSGNVEVPKAIQNGINPALTQPGLK